MDTNYLNLSKEDLCIKILDYLCENKSQKITSEKIKGNLFPELELNVISDLFEEIWQWQIQPIHRFKYQHIPSLKYANGLEDYIKNRKRMIKKQKLHRIVEFLSTEKERQQKSSFDSGEIAKAFNPELSIYEVNSLCETLIANEDVRDVSTSQSHERSMLEVLVTTRTLTAYHTKRYLEEDEEIIIPIHHNISAKNVIVGDVAGTINQQDNSTISTGMTNTKPYWLNKWYWVVTILVGIVTIVMIIINLIKNN
jgi:hypothetical protein